MKMIKLSSVFLRLAVVAFLVALTPAKAQMTLEARTLCAVRSIALDAASALLPACRRGDAVACEVQRTAVYKGLSLQSRCKISTLPANKAPLGSEVSATLPVGSTVFYVGTNGSDANNGLDTSAPFLTIPRALQAVKTRPLNESKVIIILTGQYRLNSTITLGPEHSNLVLTGESPTTRPRLTATIPLPRATNPCTSLATGIVKCQLDPTIASKLDPLSALFVNGGASIRAREPDVSEPTQYAYDGRKPKNWGESDPFPLVNAIDMRITPSDNPNVTYDPYAPRYSNFTLGFVSASNNNTFNPPVAYFLNPNHVAQGGCPRTVPTFASWGTNVFNKIWKNPSTALFHAMHWYGWGQWTFSIKSQTLNQVVFDRGGWQEARGDCDKGGGTWYIENVIEALDAPNEYFLSLATNELYFYPPSDEKNPALSPDVKLELTLPLQKLVQVVGTSPLQLAKNIMIKNIEFFGAHTTTMERFEVPSGGDWSLHRSGALFLENVNQVLVQDCLFQWCGGNALFVSKKAGNITIERNEFYALGASAILVVGDPGFYTADPWIIKNYPDTVKIVGNLASFIGLHVKQVSGTFISLASKTLVEGNVFFWGPRAGITMNDQFGSPQVIRRNVVFEMVRGTSDHGPFILWNRQQFVGPPKEFDLIEENVFIGTPGLGTDGGGKGINVDDGAHKILTRNNIIAVGFHKIKGSYVNAQGNIIIYPVVASCVYFSHMNRIPAHLTFGNNSCVSKFPPYSYGVSGLGLRGYCDNLDNFVAARNTFYYQGKNDKMEACALSWQTWTNSYRQDQGTFYLRTKTLPPPSTVTSWILNKLAWIPR